MTALALVMAGSSVSAAAQESAESRISRVEAEVRALQRKVFPGADGKFFQPEITPGQTAGTTTTPPPSTTAVTDLLTRMDAIEGQMARLTAQIEQDGNRISQIEARLGMGAAAPAATTGTAPAASVTPLPGTTTAPTPTPTPTPTPAPAAQTNLDAMTGGASAAKPPAPAPSSRVQAVSAIIKPQTADPGDDEYSYGYRLWEARFFPEAQQQLKLFLEKYPRHARASFGRNLLGRAYLDDGNPREAAKWFLQNYQADKRGDRAPDSLLYLAVSMKALKDTKRACIALAEFSQTYAAEAAGRLAGTYNSTKNGLDCAS
ncbi:tetratricopeptide repeat protein [Novosphingobium album (ex Liu et al. 2023)]|uniref:Tetratricopeptide repeat protein n=1 Tax=Novosphingobium album (ex Liu et al. 2023) TaxID=3031130 RepID=A0ABT5WJG0_9SPHN|nr:hypothetical protein [Novosphingobium album (ex Liu et al. 2023)]MDE8650178.1 hypothetical protein [Novosphingobium album (ex Liu et al. 2023)]